jgi:DNA-binding MarR family transcriptional regulator
MMRQAQDRTRLSGERPYLVPTLSRKSDFSPTPTPLHRQDYRQTLMLLDQAYHQLLNAVRCELDRRGIHAINNVQALLLHNFGNQVFRVSELCAQGRYTGSNVSYSLRKLVDLGYIHRKTSPTDRRSVLVQLTSKGEEVRDLLEKLFDRQADCLAPVADISGSDLRGLNAGFEKFSRFWRDQVRFQL